MCVICGFQLHRFGPVAASPTGLNYDGSTSGGQVTQSEGMRKSAYWQKDQFGGLFKQTFTTCNVTLESLSTPGYAVLLKRSILLLYM